MAGEMEGGGLQSIRVWSGITELCVGVQGFKAGVGPSVRKHSRTSPGSCSSVVECWAANHKGGEFNSPSGAHACAVGGSPVGGVREATTQ